MTTSGTLTNPGDRCAVDITSTEAAITLTLGEHVNSVMLMCNGDSWLYSESAGQTTGRPTLAANVGLPLTPPGKSWTFYAGSTTSAVKLFAIALG